MRIKVTVKKGPTVIVSYVGILEVEANESLFDTIIKTEQALEVLTGLRHHIEQAA